MTDLALVLAAGLACTRGSAVKAADGAFVRTNAPLTIEATGIEID